MALPWLAQGVAAGSGSRAAGALLCLASRRVSRPGRGRGGFRCGRGEGTHTRLALRLACSADDGKAGSSANLIANLYEQNTCNITLALVDPKEMIADGQVHQGHRYFLQEHAFFHSFFLVPVLCVFAAVACTFAVVVVGVTVAAAVAVNVAMVFTRTRPRCPISPYWIHNCFGCCFLHGMAWPLSPGRCTAPATVLVLSHIRAPRPRPVRTQTPQGVRLGVGATMAGQPPCCAIGPLDR